MGVYNDAARVTRAVRSILQQSFRDLELLVVDDGSTDGTSAVLDQLASADARLSVIHQANSGLTRALIRGCALARGEFIARQDADDWSHPCRIERQLALLDSDRRVGFVSCATEYVGPKDEHLTIVRRPVDPERATYGLLYERQGPPAHGSVMFRKAEYLAAGSYRDEFRFSQDSDLWLRLAERCQISYLDEVYYHHRKEATSISGARRQQQSEFARLAHACREARLSGESEAPMLRTAAQLTLEAATPSAFGSRGVQIQGLDITYLIGSQLVINGDARARAYLLRVINQCPGHWRAWLRLMQSILSGWVRRPS